jgi:hypothetical protein
MLVAVVSVKGSPGVTTFSVALAARWPAPMRTLLVEADPSGGDLGIRFSLQSAPGMVSLAAAARRSEDPMLCWQHAQALPGGLPVVTAPPDADRARAALSALADPSTGATVLRSAGTAPDTVVIVDCGRVDAASAAMPIVRAADAMVLLTRAHAEDLAHLARRLPVLGRWNTRPAMLLVGEGYSPAEVARELGVHPWGRVPDDPRGAAVLCGRAPVLRWGRSGPSRSALGQFAHKVAKVILAEQAPPPVLPHQGPAPRQSAPVVRSVPGTPMPVGGLRLAPPPGAPDRGPGGTGTPRGGGVS